LEVLRLPFRGREVRVVYKNAPGETANQAANAFACINGALAEG